MLFRSLLILTSLATLPFLGSCTTRYQDLLRDRDQQIRELNGRVATLLSTNEDLERQAAAARSEAEQMRAQPPSAPQASDAGQTKKLQDELQGTTVGYRRGRLSIAIDDSVTFDSGSVTLKDSSHKVVKRVAEALKRDYGDRRIYIEGHTDSDPIQRTKDKYKDNMDLSLKRAYAVRDYLVDQCGIPERRVVVVGYGQYDPKDAANKARNRRVEVVVGESM